MMKEIKITFNSLGEKLKGVLCMVNNNYCVVLSHGLYSFKDTPKYKEIAKEFYENNISTFRFDYSGCGESEGDIKESNLQKRITNLKDAINFILTNYNFRNIGLLGSSFGGLVSIFNYNNEKVNCIVCLATPYMDKLKELKNITNILLIHGDKDEIVPYQDSIKIYNQAEEPKRLELIPNADHRFTDYNIRKKVITLALEWFKDYIPKEERS